MDNNNTIKQFCFTGPEAVIELKKHPSMAYIFTKALLISLFRSNSIKDEKILEKSRFILKNYNFDNTIIHAYKKVCGFSTDRVNEIPVTYLQSLFIGIFGQYITSSYFPINPLGLIHVFQSFDQKRPVNMNETVDLSCTLDQVTKTEKGIESAFRLSVSSDNEIVWQGTSIFLTKSHSKKKKRSPNIEEHFLKKQETLPVPEGTGLKYAKVSGDYNPHHLYSFLARAFGFKKAIAHGMWSLANVISSIDKTYPLNATCKIETFFKLPIFMPATTALGYETEKNDQGNTIVHFELRDDQEGLPHLKGRVHL